MMYHVVKSYSDDLPKSNKSQIGWVTAFTVNHFTQYLCCLADKLKGGRMCGYHVEI